MKSKLTNAYIVLSLYPTYCFLKGMVWGFNQSMAGKPVTPDSYAEYRRNR